MYGGSKLLLLILILRGIELHFISNGDSVSVSVSYRYERLFQRNRNAIIERNETDRTDHVNSTSNVLLVNATAPSKPIPKGPDPSPTETCFDAPNGTCRVVPCRPSQPAGPGHFRGWVREVSPRRFPSPVCGVCRTYGFQCAVSTQHRFIYIHVMKSGGSSTHLFLKSALCQLKNSSNPPLRPSTTDYACQPHQFALMDCTSAVRSHPAFFRWTVVRHPIPRAVSAWAMASRRPAGGAGPVDFNTWAVNTSALPTRVWALHWQPQVDFVMDQRGCPMYHFAATMGPAFAADMEAVLGRIGAPALWAEYRRRGGVPREYASADAVREAAYRGLSESAAAAAALAERYRGDLAAFGFRMEGWREDGFF